jgi:hypothetical protein
MPSGAFPTGIGLPSTVLYLPDSTDTVLLPELVTNILLLTELRGLKAMPSGCEPTAMPLVL